MFANGYLFGTNVLIFLIFYETYPYPVGSSNESEIFYSFR